MAINELVGNGAKALALCALGLFGVFGRALAADWRVVTRHTSPTQVVEIDLASIVRTPEGRLLAWERHTFDEPQPVPGSSDKTFIVDLSLTDVDCARRLIGVRAFTYYAKDRSLVDSGQGSGALKNVVPESNGEIIMQFICRSRTAKPKLRPSDQSGGLSSFDFPEDAKSKK
jgi:hypothetical protein